MAKQYVQDLARAPFLCSVESNYCTVKQINKALTKYILDECDQSLPPNIQATQDLKAIATDASAVETTTVGDEALACHADAYRTTQLLKMSLIAAINSPKAMEYIGKMPTLSTTTQASLKSIIEEVLSSLHPWCAQLCIC
jgi:hypothetical protein